MLCLFQDTISSSDNHVMYHKLRCTDSLEEGILLEWIQLPVLRGEHTCDARSLHPANTRNCLHCSADDCRHGGYVERSVVMQQ